MGTHIQSVVPPSLEHTELGHTTGKKRSNHAYKLVNLLSQSCVWDARFWVASQTHFTWILHMCAEVLRVWVVLAPWTCTNIVIPAPPQSIHLLSICDTNSFKHVCFPTCVFFFNLVVQCKKNFKEETNICPSANSIPPKSFLFPGQVRRCPWVGEGDLSSQEPWKAGCYLRANRIQSEEYCADIWAACSRRRRT